MNRDLIKAKKLALNVSELSKDPITKVGAVVLPVMELQSDLQEFFTGWNYIPNALDCYKNWQRPTKYKYVIHAEMNAINNCLLNGYSTNGATLVVTHYPCRECAKLIVDAGIGKVYYIQDYRDMRDCVDLDAKRPQEELFEACGVIVEKYDE